MVIIRLERTGQNVTRSNMTTTELTKIYIAGPMRGYEQLNYPAFYKAEKYLKSKKVWKPINPARMDDEIYGSEESLDHVEALKRDIDEIFEAEAMYMLRGWTDSKGALVEHALALYLGLYIMYQ